MDSCASGIPALKRCCGVLRQVFTGERFFGVSRPPSTTVRTIVAGARSEKEALCRALAQAVHDCTRCCLHAQRTRTVFGEGDVNTAVMFIGEAPGEHEDLEGRPFVGEAGRLLTNIIEAMGLRREGVFITNIVRCRPAANREPRPEEIVQCRPHLVALVQLIRPRVICALGSHAARALTGDTQPISRLRGQWHRFEGVPLMPTYHPAYLLRVSRDKRLVWEDMKKVMALLQAEQSPAEIDSGLCTRTL